MLLQQILLLQTEMTGVWGVIQDQIFPVLLLALAVYWFQKRSASQEKQINDLFTQIIDDEKKDNQTLMEVIKEHNQVMTGINTTMNRMADIFEKLI